MENLGYFGKLWRGSGMSSVLTPPIPLKGEVAHARRLHG